MFGVVETVGKEGMDASCSKLVVGITSPDLLEHPSSEEKIKVKTITR